MATTSSHSMYRVLPPSEPPDGERSCCFRLAVVGGTQLRGSWYLSAIVRLQGFSSGSPAASPRRWSPKTVTTKGGEKQAGLRPLPLPQLQGCSSSVLGRGVRRVGACLRAGSGSLLPSVIGGKGVRHSWGWQLPRVWLSGLSGFGAASGATSHRGSQKRFLRRRDSRRHPGTDLQLYGLLHVLAPRAGTWARALSQQRLP
jgi:hypothetical protein